MGADAGVRCKDKEIRDRMLAFLKANMRPWHIVGAGGRWVLGQPYEGGDGSPFIRTEEVQADGTSALCDVYGQNVLGFDLGYDMPSREYTYGVLRWIALVAGDCKIPTNGDEEDPEPIAKSVDRPVPYILYDGYEEWPVLRHLEWDGRTMPPDDGWLVNEQGWKPYLRHWRPENRPGRDPISWDDETIAEHEAEADDCDRIVSAELDRLVELWNAQEST